MYQRCSHGFAMQDGIFVRFRAAMSARNCQSSFLFVCWSLIASVISGNIASVISGNMEW